MTVRGAPPRRWRWVLSRTLPVRDRDDLMLELDEAYARRVDRRGVGAADRWYREEVMGFVFRVPLQGARRVKRPGGDWTMDGLRELRQIARGLGRAPGFAILASLTFAIGIGANALIFAIVDHALLRPPPYPEPDEIVVVMEGWSSSLGSLEILQQDLTTVSQIGGAMNAAGMTLEPMEGSARRVSVAQVSPEYLSVLSPSLEHGRLFRPDESEPGRGRVVLLGADFFASYFGADPSVLNSSLRIDGDDYLIVGVLPPGFDMPSAQNDLWIPATMDASPEKVGYHWGMGAYSMIARANAGVTPERVREDVLLAQERVRTANPLWTPPSGFWDEGVFSTLSEARGRWARTPLLILLGAVVVVLFVVCANVANLLLSRALARRRDLAVRTALGAGGARLARLQMGEALVLAVIGGVLGLGLALGGLELLRPMLPEAIPGRNVMKLDPRVLGATALVTLLVALVAGLLSAARVARQSPGAFLRESGRGRTASVGRRSTTAALITVQLAAAVVLVTGSGLLARSLYNMTRVDPGFATENRVTARVDLPPGLGDDSETRVAYFGQLKEALEADASLDGVALASSIPFGSEFENIAVLIPGVTQDPNNLPVVQQRRVTSDFFEISSIPVVAGRAFTNADRLDTELVAIVDVLFAERFFPGEDPVGRNLRYPWRGAPDIRIVGVVGATSDDDLSAAAEPVVWFPLIQASAGLPGHAVLVARSRGESDVALGAIQSRVREFDDRAAVSELSTYAELLSRSLETARLMSTLLLLFAGATLVLGSVGVYGVAAFSARERIREIGVRMTLGANSAEIRSSFFREGLLLALPGGLLGLGIALFTGRLLQSFLFEVSPFDPATFVLTPLVLGGAALAAVYLPARRATTVDPATVLRAE